MKKSQSSAILSGNCPRCREGKMFKNSALSLKFSEMNEKCEHCGLLYEVEKGFFWGAMYFSYAFSVAIFVFMFFATMLMFEKPSLSTYMANIILPNILFVPFSFRISRVMMLHFFGGVDFDDENAQD
jgi:uncharacterized protein (DUF983 family)